MTVNASPRGRVGYVVCCADFRRPHVPVHIEFRDLLLKLLQLLPHPLRFCHQCQRLLLGIDHAHWLLLMWLLLLMLLLVLLLVLLLLHLNMLLLLGRDSVLKLVQGGHLLDVLQGGVRRRHWRGRLCDGDVAYLPVDPHRHGLQGGAGAC